MQKDTESLILSTENRSTWSLSGVKTRDWLAFLDDFRTAASLKGKSLMPKGYLFDTVACSRWRRGDIELRSKVEALSSDVSLYTSVISVGELILGIHKAPLEHKEKLWQRTQEMLTRFKSILEVTREIAERYGEIVSKVPPGQHIGQNDYWIDAIALIHDLILITNDPDFDQVLGLQKENWLE